MRTIKQVGISGLLTVVIGTGFMALSGCGDDKGAAKSTIVDPVEAKKQGDATADFYKNKGAKK